MEQPTLTNEFCYNHPKVEASGICSRCHAPVCGKCRRRSGICVVCFLKEPITLPGGSQRGHLMGPIGTDLISKRDFFAFVWNTTTLYGLCFVAGMVYLVIFALIWGLRAW